MHATQREKLILSLLEARGFLSFREIEAQLDASPATLRRDLERMAAVGQLARVRGGVRPVGETTAGPAAPHLGGVPQHENAHRHPAEKAAIGKAAAALCAPGEGVMIDGGSTTLQMCPHLAGLSLQVLTNSLHIVSALLPQPSVRILLPAGTVFREQSLILSTEGEDAMPRFHAPKLFMGAAALGAQGPMQADPVLVGAQRRLIERAEQIIVLADSSKFLGSSGHVVCGLDEIDTVVTDAGVADADRKMIEAAGVRLVVAS